jgi:hypothetical protein
MLVSHQLSPCMLFALVCASHADAICRCKIMPRLRLRLLIYANVNVFCTCAADMVIGCYSSYSSYITVTIVAMQDADDKVALEAAAFWLSFTCFRAWVVALTI